MEGIFDEFLKPESKNMYKNRRNGIYCESCHNQDVESQSHVLVCLAYDKLRLDKAEQPHHLLQGGAGLQGQEGEGQVEQ